MRSVKTNTLQGGWTGGAGAGKPTATRAVPRGDAVLGILFWLIVGALAGWLAGKIMRGGGFGLLGNIVVGIVGALIGGALFRMMGLPPVSTLGSLISATVGACVLLYLVSLARKG